MFSLRIKLRVSNPCQVWYVFIFEASRVFQNIPVVSFFSVTDSTFLLAKCRCLCYNLYILSTCMEKLKKSAIIATVYRTTPLSLITVLIYNTSNSKKNISTKDIASDFRLPWILVERKERGGHFCCMYWESVVQQFICQWNSIKIISTYLLCA